MGALHSHELVVFFLGVVVLLAAARALGELVRRWGQPAVLGEMIAGVVLGPSILGRCLPDAQRWLFPREGPASIALDAVVSLGVTLLLLVAGLEIDLRRALQRGRAALGIAVSGVVVPLAVGAGLVVAAPEWLGVPRDRPLWQPALGVGAALAVSALPVIARILLDLTVLQTDLGLLILVAATLINLSAWLMASIVLGGATGAGVAVTLGLTLAFVVLVLVLGRRCVDGTLPWVQAHFRWPSGALSYVLAVGLAGAAVTEAIGIHAIFGAFLAGIVLGESTHLSVHTREILSRFVDGILAPLFIAAIGLEIDLGASFRPDLILAVLIVGTGAKTIACGLAARRCGMNAVEARAVGFALNARGELGIVLAMLAWRGGLLGEPLFVALVVLALSTSAMAGPLLRRILRRETAIDLSALLERASCRVASERQSITDFVGALARDAARRAGQDGEAVAAAVLARVAAGSTAIAPGVLIPHARLEGLRAPILAVGLRPAEACPAAGIEMDGESARLVVLILTSRANYTDQLRVLASVSALIRDVELLRRLLEARTATALRAALRIGSILSAKPHHPEDRGGPHFDWQQREVGTATDDARREPASVAIRGA